MKKPQKRFFLIMTLLEALAIAGCFVFNYFTVNKLGMVRWVNFHSMKWGKAYPILTVQIILSAALIVCAALLVWVYLKRRGSTRKLVGFMAVFSAILALAAVGYMLLMSLETMRAYYFICIMLAAAALLQLIKTAVALVILPKDAPKPEEKTNEEI